MTQSTDQTGGSNHECRIPTEALCGLLLRLAVGLLFLTAGLSKFLGQGGAAGASAGIRGMFADTWLPGFLVTPFAYGLPYVEVVLGVVLLAGAWARAAMTAASLLLILLSFGMLVKGNGAVAANNFFYVFMATVGLWFVGQSNRFGLDHYLRRKR